MNFAAARKSMVDCQVRPNDVTDHALLSRIATVPKEDFLPSGVKNLAYVETELTIAPGRMVLTARDFSKLVQATGIKKTDLVLDLAAGGGYTTAILAGLAGMVVAVEEDEKLAGAAEEALARHDITNAAVITASPVEGAKSQGPFDLIFIGGVIEKAPQALLDQLKEGGRLAAIVLEDKVSNGVVFTQSNGVISKTSHFTSSAKTILPGFEKKAGFEF